MRLEFSGILLVEGEGAGNSKKEAAAEKGFWASGGDLSFPLKKRVCLHNPFDNMESKR